VTVAIRKHYKDFLAVVLLFVVALGVGGYILSNQRLYLPHWVPFVGSDFVDRKFELSTAQSLTPGQGQEISIAGVKVGEISKVELVDGVALVTTKVRRKYDKRIMRDASGLVRPKTGLNDQTIQLNPGTRAAGHAPANFVVPVGRVLPNVNADEVLASLDGDTRDYLRALLSGAGQGLKNNSRELSNTFRRFEPTGRDLAKLTGLLKERRQNIRRSIHNFSLLSQAVGEKDDQLARLVDSSNAAFQAFTNEDAALRSTLRQLPGTLSVTRTGLRKADRFARALGPAASKLRPFARALGPSLVQTRPFLRTATPIIRDQLRPFARVSLPVVKELRPAARDLASVTPDLTASLKVLNELFNELAYNPAGKEEGYLFWTAWANHAGMSVFGSQDAHGPIRHGNFLVSCSTLTTLNAVAQANPALGSVVQQVFQQQTLPIVQSTCPKQAGPGTGVPPAGGTTRSKGK
jgi:phospholipid/cholesterol/gamma-HCH transport system substrate-binding protein